MVRFWCMGMEKGECRGEILLISLELFVEIRWILGSFLCSRDIKWISPRHFSLLHPHVPEAHHIFGTVLDCQILACNCWGHYCCACRHHSADYSLQPPWFIKLLWISKLQNALETFHFHIISYKFPGWEAGSCFNMDNLWNAAGKSCGHFPEILPIFRVEMRGKFPQTCKISQGYLKLESGVLS